MLAPEPSLLAPPTSPSPLPSPPSPPPTCRFKKCTRPLLPNSDKCLFHKNRPHCSSAGCNNQVVSKNLCARHGGKKICHVEGCTANTRGRKFCLEHGGVVPKRFCSVDGCEKQAHSYQKCVRHGGGRYCKAIGCSFHARSGGLCRFHRSGTPAASTKSHESPSSSSSDDDGGSPDKSTRSFLLAPAELSTHHEHNLALLNALKAHFLPRDKPDVPRPQVELMPRPSPLSMLASLRVPYPPPRDTPNDPIEPPGAGSGGCATPTRLPSSPTEVAHPVDGAAAATAAVVGSSSSSTTSVLQDHTLMSMANLVHAMTTSSSSSSSSLLPKFRSSLYSLPRCKFNSCGNPIFAGSDKCAFHKNRTNCSFPKCTNQVVARNLCVRHGGRRLCQFEDCTAHRRGKQFCLKHGGEVPKRFCTVEGCDKQAHSYQKCVRHGGGRYCQSPGCSFHARTGGFCRNHATGEAAAADGNDDDDDDEEVKKAKPVDGLLMLQMCATGAVDGL
ncbi:hypothetical protein H257_09219 [Aphanomyces astaci]|uniref:Uncharacterized protein n=1 Tax=Aphanomyces astaci TaxID=112090 RepID=W4GCG2_APHAT|nr:hypothetical protein H257_09219 [Aphanomyces astaci]ETV76759.1 hypothetical protein H257_09219 [Aphanomyces astaci]RQM27560.1 hypothetical protein B5M09_006647 [Aphanomyces astaci]|eukprot:XP_009833671.1 hypothetical protein H257_09219 [Aphanomyces astaci]